MDKPNHERFLAANHTLRDFLRRAESLASGRCPVAAEDLEAMRVRLLNPAPEVGDASRGETLDVVLLTEVAEYVKNFRALQDTFEKIRATARNHGAKEPPELSSVTYDSA
jgi:hypothetical protein